VDCVVVYFDGACEPVNPGGVGSYGFVAYRENNFLHGEGGVACVGERWCTNNYAEYTALIKALEWSLSRRWECVEARGDSQLVVRQIEGLYQVRSHTLKTLYERALQLAERFSTFRITWVPRYKNREADRYSKEAYCKYLQADPHIRERYVKHLATERQIAILKRLGIEPSPCLSKREASQLIEKTLGGRRKRENQ